MTLLRAQVDRIIATLDRTMVLTEDGAPQLITVHGGLPRDDGGDTWPHATVQESDQVLEAWPGEGLDAFKCRAVEWAAELGASTVIVGGLPRRNPP